MAATPKAPQKFKLDYFIDRQVYDMYVKTCSSKGFAPQIILEKLMRKYSETGQI
jgi:hypothetical protein